MSAIQNLHSFGKPGEGRGPGGGGGNSVKPPSAAEPRQLRAEGTVGRVGSRPAPGCPEGTGGRSALGRPGVSDGAFTNGSGLSAGHTRPPPATPASRPLRHRRCQGAGRDGPASGFRLVASAGWGTACRQGSLARDQLRREGGPRAEGPYFLQLQD